MNTLVLGAHHARDAGSADVDVADANLRARGLSKRVCEHRGEGGFSDAAFSGEDQELVSDGGHAEVD